MKRQFLGGSILLMLGACPAEQAPAGTAGAGETSDTAPPPTTAEPTTADPTAATAGATTGATETASESDSDTSIKVDVLGIPDTPASECAGQSGNGGVELSYIWIANSSQGTISKLDTQTVEEVGRYQAKPSGGDPSRTSVNLVGDVAVANRNGGVAKFWASPENCNGGNTSEGAGDILPWGEDDCLAWYTPFVCSSNRPVAWTRGEWNEGACTYQNAKLWTVCNSDIMLLNGDTGEVEETVVIPGSAFIYGGAADADGNFWGLDYSQVIGRLIRVDHESLELTGYPGPPNGSGYGITVDSVGRPWFCGGGGVSRFNLEDSTWTSAGSTGGIGGCMTDGQERIWHSNGSGTLLGFNIETLDIEEQVSLPEYVHGVSVDFYGFVWGVSFAGNNAYRADPETGDVITYSGLTGAYTYSDMTGFSLFTAGGGGVPPG